MGESRPLDISLASLIKWVLPWMLALAAFGVLPTYLMVGWTGVYSQLVAVGMVLTVMMGIGILTVRAAQAGPARAATVFMGSCVARLVLCPVLLGLLQWATSLPLAPMAIWMVIIYIATLGLEVVWLIKALRHDVARQQAEKAARRNETPAETTPKEPHDFSI